MYNYAWSKWGTEGGILWNSCCLIILPPAVTIAAADVSGSTTNYILQKQLPSDAFGKSLFPGLYSLQSTLSEVCFLTTTISHELKRSVLLVFVLITSLH